MREGQAFPSVQEWLQPPQALELGLYETLPAGSSPLQDTAGGWCSTGGGSCDLFTSRIAVYAVTLKGIWVGVGRNVETRKLLMGLLATVLCRPRLTSCS